MHFICYVVFSFSLRLNLTIHDYYGNVLGNTSERYTGSSACIGGNKTEVKLLKLAKNL